MRAVERREEKILENAAIVVVVLHRIGVELALAAIPLQGFVKAVALEELFQRRYLLADEPGEHEARDEADDRFVIVFAVVFFVRKVVGERDARIRGERPRVPLEEAPVELLRQLLHGKGVLERRKGRDRIAEPTAQNVVRGGGIDVEALALRGIVLELASVGLAGDKRDAEVAVRVVEEEEPLRREPVYAASATGDGVLDGLLGERELDKAACAFREVALHLDRHDDKRFVGRCRGICLGQTRDPAQTTRFREIRVFVLRSIDGNRLGVGLER